MNNRMKGLISTVQSRGLNVVVFSTLQGGGL